MKKARGTIPLPNGRNKCTRFVQLPEYFLASAAYRSLLPIARALLVEIKRLYKGNNNGELFLSIHDGARLLGVVKNTAAKAFDQLIDRGFIRARRKGSFDYKQRHAREWVLTEYALGDALPEKAFMNWSPDEKYKTRVQNLRQSVSILATGDQKLIPRCESKREVCVNN